MVRQDYIDALFSFNPSVSDIAVAADNLEERAERLVSQSLTCHPIFRRGFVIAARDLFETADELRRTVYEAAAFIVAPMLEAA